MANHANIFARGGQSVSVCHLAKVDQKKYSSANVARLPFPFCNEPLRQLALRKESAPAGKSLPTLITLSAGHGSSCGKSQTFPGGLKETWVVRWFIQDHPRSSKHVLYGPLRSCKSSNPAPTCSPCAVNDQLILEGQCTQFFHTRMCLMSEHEANPKSPWSNSPFCPKGPKGCHLNGPHRNTLISEVHETWWPA